MINLLEECDAWAFTGRAVIVDTSVLVDFALETSPRHADALNLIRRLVDRRFRIRVPFHAAFEFQAACRRSIRFEGGRHTTHANSRDRSLVVPLHLVPIDTAFLEHYVTVDLPHLKAGDLIFLALARADNVPLVTENQQLYDKAREVGVKVFKVGEYLATL